MRIAKAPLSPNCKAIVIHKCAVIKYGCALIKSKMFSDKPTVGRLVKRGQEDV